MLDKTNILAQIALLGVYLNPKNRDNDCTKKKQRRMVWKAYKSGKLLYILRQLTRMVQEDW